MTTVFDLIDSARGRFQFEALHESMSTSELLQSAEGYARRLRSSLDDVVAVALEATPECVALVLGAWLAGVTVASIPSRPRGMSRDRYVDNVSRMLALLDRDVVYVDAAKAEGPFRPMRELGDARLARHIDLSGTGGFVQFSSGTTSDPKGIALGPGPIAANLEALVRALEFDLQPCRGVSWLPLSHDMGLFGGALFPLVSWHLSGESGVIVLAKPVTFVRNPIRWLRLCSESSANITCAPTVAYELATRQLKLVDSSGIDLASLSVAVVGAEMVRADVLERFEAVASPMGFSDTAFTPAYGLGEATLCVTTVRPGERWKALDQPAVDSTIRPPAVCVGKPLERMTVSVDDGDDDRTIIVGGPSLYSGYLSLAGESVADLVASPPLPRVVTGDDGFMMGDELYITGRTTNRLVVSGRNLAAEDVEAAVMSVPSLVPHACAALDDGHGRYLLVAEVEGRAATGSGGVQRDIRRALLERVGVGPSAVVLIRRGTMPRTPSGKVKRHAAARMLTAGELDVIGEDGSVSPHAGRRQPS